MWSLLGLLDSGVEMYVMENMPRVAVAYSSLLGRRRKRRPDRPWLSM